MMDKSSLFLLLLNLWTLSSLAQPPAEEIEQCPDRILGNEQRRTCPKKCQQDKDCGNKRQCLCDGPCGLSCVAPGRACPWPLPPGESFSVTLLSPSPSFSALLEVRCHPGHTMADGVDAIIRRCQGDRQWSGNDPVCTVGGGFGEKVVSEAGGSCVLPDDELLVVRGSTEVGASIQYECTAGTVLLGNSDNVCLQNQTWRYPHPICQRVFCPQPLEVDRGDLVAVQKSEYQVGDTVYYLCKKTYLLDGPNQVTCQSNGTWSTVPFCRARCPIPAQRSRVLVGGEKRWPYDLTDGMVAHGEEVTFFCKHPEKHCSYTAAATCFDSRLTAPSCYLDPTWFQYKLYPHRLVSEINTCDPADLEGIEQ
ncbi:beta-2-glycoprotein 1-like isoform X1 [Astyanax mexicanus]|uniref:Beta-2-glycoprotein 1 n=1 Tax=Astyanax mexicanus TaxID=7994 RepID=A0A8T2LWD9_ASTMX|nr:beta-2-glycoprotein 1-like isoform X1 [Astyanax mexicanus]